MDFTDILIKPIVTEKMSHLGEKLNRFAFVVNKNANKIQIKEAVEQMYNVQVDSVNTLIVPAKQRTRYTKTSIMKGRKPSYKKAIVTIAKGDTIDFFSNI